MKKKYNEIERGDKFVYFNPYRNEVRTFEVGAWIPNPKAGNPIKDMWGGTVYEEDAGHFDCTCLEDGTHNYRLNYFVGSENRTANEDFFTTEEEKQEIIRYYKKKTYSEWGGEWISRVSDFLKEVDKLRKSRDLYGPELNKGEFVSEPMAELIKAINDLQVAYVKVRIKSEIPDFEEMQQEFMELIGKNLK